MGDLLDKAILASRWLLAVFYLGLAVALALYAVKFAMKVAAFGATLFAAEDNAALLALLYLLDSALVASLVVTVTLASWDTLVSGLGGEDRDGRLAWVAKLALGNLKIKLATALVAISGINLLQLFLEIGQTPDRVLTWAIAIHCTFLLSVVALAVADRLEGKAGKAADGNG